MAEVLRVEVHLVDASPVCPGDEWEPLGGDRADGVGGGAFSRGSRASLEDGPAVARAPGRLPTGARVGGGFRPGRVVTRTPDGRTRLEWACRGPVLHHLRRIQDWAVRAIEVQIREGEAGEDQGASSSASRLETRAVALVTLCTPSSLWRRGKFEPKDAKRRVAVADVFGHAASFEVPPGAGSCRDETRAGFCGVVGCLTHDARRGKRGGLAASLENLKPPVPSPRPIQPARADAPCAADAGEDAIAVIAGFLDARSAACLAATCGGMRDRMDCHASGLSASINLHPHQRAGLAWMRRRERPGNDARGCAPDPRWRGPLFESFEEEKTKNQRETRGYPFWVDVVTGALSSTAPPRFADAPGGLLCDEPGLGKTVTALALVLARKGARASPPPGFRARRCAETGGWYYAGAPRLAGAAHGDEDVPTSAFGSMSATPGVGGPDSLTRGSGPSASARRSKRSRSSTPTGHFAAMERAAFEFSNPNSKAKRRRKSAAAAAAQGMGAPKELFPASSEKSRLGPNAQETSLGFEGSASAPSPRREEAAVPSNFPGVSVAVTPQQTNPHDVVQTNETTNPPFGFVSLSASSRAALSEGVTSRRNVAFFRRAMDAARRAVGLDPVEDVVEFILMNRGGTKLITNEDPLLLPKWRFGDDPRPARALFELGLRPASAQLAKETPKDWVWVPPGPAAVADASASTNTSTSCGDSCAFDVESLDEARSLAREGADIERDLDARVYLSNATLVVLPPVLISHWLEQIHFVTGGARDGPSVCVVGGGTDADGAPIGGFFPSSRNHPDDTRWLFGVSPDETPGATPSTRDADDALFATGRTRKRQAHFSLPSFEGLTPASLASSWDIVLMPANRLSTEFSQLDSPLLKVHWARVVLDEGHQMGGASSITAKLSMACALKAHARWVMTGTPTPATLKGAGVGHLQPLLAFLGNAPFGTSQTAWTNAIQKPLERFGNSGSRRGGASNSVAGTTKARASTKGSERLPKGKGKEAVDDDASDAKTFDGASHAARLFETAAEEECARAEAAARLGSLLRRVAIRTLKSDIRLPPLKRTVKLLPFTKRHASAYNELVAFLRRGLLLADWADPNHVESLLNVRQSKLASEAVTNLREAACVTGEFPVTCFAAEIDETMDDLTEALLRRNSGLSRTTARQTAEALRYPLANHRGECAKCGAESFMPMLTPCAHLLCSSCVTVVPGEEELKENDFLHETRAPVRCPVCASTYVMQGAAPREDNPAPRRAVPQDLIEIQPSYVQHAWRMTDALEAQGESTKVEHLLSRLRAIGAAPSLEDRAKERVEELGVEAGAHGDAIANAAALGSPSGDASHSSHAAPKLWRWVRPSHKAPPPKCIVYSGFRTHLSVIDLGLTGAGVNFENIARMGMTRSQKDAALASFRADDQVAVLLLDRAAAEGLDLSFASRVFVMEPLDNASLEQQVVSRAHRMGQRETVQVEVLAMAGTAEETLLDVQAELAAAAAAEAEAATRKRRDADDEDDDDGSDSEDAFEEGGAEGRIAAAVLSHSEAAFGNGNSGAYDTHGTQGGGVAPSVAAEALSRRRVLQSLKLVPIPDTETEDDRRVASGEGDDVAAERAAAANAAANVEANRLAAIAAETAATTRTREASGAGDPAPAAAPRRRGVTFADDEAAPAPAPAPAPQAPPAPPAPPPRGSRGWTVRVRARAVAEDGAPLALAELGPVHVRLPLGGATTAAKLRDATAKALRDACAEAGVSFDADEFVEALFLAPECLSGLSEAKRTIGIPLDGGALSRLGVEDRASLEATIRVASAGGMAPRGVGEISTEMTSPGAAADGRRLGGSPAAAGVGGVAGGLSSLGPGASFGPGEKNASPDPSGGRKGASGTFRGKKQRLGSGEKNAAVGVVEDDAVASPATEASASASASAAARIFSSSSPPRAGRVLDADALDRRVARRVAAVAAADDVSSAAMLRNPDAADGADGVSFAGVPSASAMSLDLLRAAELSSARGTSADPTVASLQSVFRSVVAERLNEAEGNAKVSSALAGSFTIERMRDGRLLVRYRDSNGKEKTDVVADLPPAVLPFVLRAVAADSRTSPSARANLAPASMAVASPRVFWAVVRHGNVGGPNGISFAEAFQRLAPGAADWEGIARRTRAKPERYNEYVSH